MSKIHANRGVRRHKKPLQNLVYRIEIQTEEQMRSNSRLTDDEFEYVFGKYRLSDGTFAIFYFQFEKILNTRGHWSCSGFITEQDLKTKLEGSMWSKFRQGRRIFTVQRRKDGKNL